MKNKLAVWSWVLPIVSLVLYVIVEQVLARANLEPFLLAQDRSILVISSFILLSISLVGFYLGSVGFRRAEKNPELSGKMHAHIGMILNILLFFFILLGLASGLFA